jgi:Kelch motif/Galactose oxidase, central domain
VLVAGGGGFPCSATPIPGGPPFGNICYASVNSTSELYDPATGSWTFSGSLSRRSSHSATLLSNGTVLVVGGWNFGVDIGYISTRLDTAELYDPAAGSWRPTSSPTTISGFNSAVRLQNGKVLVVGIQSARGTAELYDPATESWQGTGTTDISGPLISLPNGSVLIAGGPSAQVYDPKIGTWNQTSPLNVIRGAHTATLLRNGRVLVIGNQEDGRTAAELYDPATATWAVAAYPKFLHYGSTATLLANGNVLLAGGFGSSFRSSALAEIYNPTLGEWSSAPSLLNGRANHTATALSDGRVLVTGGIDGDGDAGTVFLASGELFDLNLPESTTLSVRPDTVAQGQCFKLTVPDGSNLILDVQYRHDGRSVETIPNWPVLDGAGQANICTSRTTQTGTYEFTAIRNSGTVKWISISSTITVTPAIQAFTTYNP